MSNEKNIPGKPQQPHQTPADNLNRDKQRQGTPKMDPKLDQKKDRQNQDKNR